MEEFLLLKGLDAAAKSEERLGSLGRVSVGEETSAEGPWNCALRSEYWARRRTIWSESAVLL